MVDQGAPPPSATTSPAPTEHAAGWPLLISLQQRCLRAQDLAELGFIIANETWHLLPYRQAAVFLNDQFGKPLLMTVSGLASIQEETPFTLWLGRLSRAASADFHESAPFRLEASMCEAELAEAWSEWWPPHAAFVPLTDRQGQRLGMVILVRDTPWQNDELPLLGLLSPHWGYCAQALRGYVIPWRAYWRRIQDSPRRRQILLGLAMAILFPVRLSALAPAEIIPLQAETVAAPMDGVIKTFHVPPNTEVKSGQPLFSLDDTTMRNRRAIADKALGVARADALAAEQKAFDNLQSKAELLVLTGRVREKEAELAYLDESLDRIEIKAANDGVFVYGDPNDWLGKPLVTGERIAQLAKPDDLGVLMWLPVGDAINLEPGAAMRVYLQVAPLSSIGANLVQTSYQATLSPDGVASYRIRGRLEPHGAARIGLRGVAKVYGGWRPLIYWVMRRPLGTFRQWLGV